MTNIPNKPGTPNNFEGKGQPNNASDGENLGLGITILETASRSKVLTEDGSTEGFSGISATQIKLNDQQALEKMGDVISQISTLKG